MIGVNNIAIIAGFDVEYGERAKLKMAEQNNLLTDHIKLNELKIDKQ